MSPYSGLFFSHNSIIFSTKLLFDYCVIAA